jgi:hypothetical protein
MLASMLAIAGEEQPMNKWSDYLRGQAVLADRLSKSMTTPDLVKEFQGYADSFRRDADAEDNTDEQRLHRIDRLKVERIPQK